MVRNTVVVDGVAEISKAVRANFRNGANFIKVFAGGGVASAYDSLELVGYTPEELKASADILLVGGNPLKDATVLRDRNNIQVIMKDGDFFKNTTVPASHPEYRIAPRADLRNTNL